MGKQFYQALLAGLIITLISQIFSGLIKLLLDGLMASFGNTFIANLFPIASWGLLALFIILLCVIFLVALQLGSSSYPIKNVREPIGYSFKRWHRKFGITHIWSQFRLSIASGLLIIAILTYHAFNPQFEFLHSLLVFIVAVDIFLQFYVANADIRNTLHRSIVQLLFTLGQQIEFSLKEALGDEPFRLRIGVFLYNNEDNRLHVIYHYNMDGEPDLDLDIGAKQGVLGRVLTDGKPWLQCPYDTEQLGFNQDQMNKIPKSIKWQMGLPLLCNHVPFGVVAIDCDKIVDFDWLDKILDFSHGMTISTSILISQFPSKEVQKSFGYESV